MITTVNGQTVKSNTDLRTAISQLRVGQNVEVGIIRDGKLRKVSAIIADTQCAGGERNVTEERNTIHSGFDGASSADAPDGGGAVVKNVEAGSPAAQNGCAMAISSSARTAARLAVAATASRARKGAATLVLEVRRGNTIILVPLRGA